MRPSSSLRVVCRFEAGTEASQLPPQCVDSHCLTLRSSRRILVCLAGSPSRSAAMSADIEPSASYVPVARQRSKIARPNDLLALLRRKRLSPVVSTAPVCRRPWQPICRRPPVDRSSCAARPSWYARRARARQPTPAIGAPHTTRIRARTHPSHRRVFRAVAGLRGDGGRSADGRQSTGAAVLLGPVGMRAEPARASPHQPSGRLIPHSYALELIRRIAGCSVAMAADLSPPASPAPATVTVRSAALLMDAER